MPTAIASRLAHIEVALDPAGWRQWAIRHNVHEDILGLLGLRPELLLKLSRDHVTVCSPRTWTMSSALHRLGLDVSACVGEGASAELRAYLELKETLPDLAPILAGQGRRIPWPEELSLRWALVVGLAFRANTAAEVKWAFDYLKERATSEWLSLFLQDTTVRFRSAGRIGELAVLMANESDISSFVDGLLEVVA